MGCAPVPVRVTVTEGVAAASLAITSCPVSTPEVSGDQTSPAGSALDQVAM